MVKFAKVSRNDNWVYGFVLVFHSSYLGNQGKDKNLESWRQFNIPTILVCVFFPQFCKCNKLLILYYIILIDFLLAFFFTWHCFSNHKSIKHPDRWFNIRFFRGKKKKKDIPASATFLTITCLCHMSLVPRNVTNEQSPSGALAFTILISIIIKLIKVLGERCTKILIYLVLLASLKKVELTS